MQLNRAFLLLIVCSRALTGCHSHHAAPGAQANEGAQTVGASKDDSPAIMDLDSSMLSLKSSSRVSVTDLLSQVWKLEDADQAHWNAIFWDSLTDTRIYPGLALFNDFTVTENARCGIRMGKWQLNKASRELSLHFDDGTTRIYIIRQIALKKMEIGWKRGDDNAIIKLSAEAIVHKRPAEDPFYPANNRWRLKPGAPETDAQIRQRVKAFVHFFSLFFLDNHLRQETDIIFSGLPCCFIWYNGGIGMQARLDLDKQWIACFYSEAEALKGYDLLASILGSHTLKWPEHPTSWVKQTGEVLEQMAGRL